MIDSERLYLRAIEKEDIYQIKEWRNSPYVKSYIFSYNFINNLQQEKWFEKYLEDDSVQLFMIVLKSNDENIGVIGLSNIDHKNQSAELNTMIGEKCHWNKGYASEAMSCLFIYAFNELNLNRITSYTYDFNEASKSKNVKQGFKREGLIRQMFYSQGKYQDIVVMGLLKEDWLKLNDTN